MAAGNQDYLKTFRQNPNDTGESIMLKQALALLIFVLSAITFSNAYACQESGCSVTVYGPVSLGGVHELNGQMYAVAIIENTTFTQNTAPSGADDDACRYGDGSWLVVRSLTTRGDNAMKADAILQMISNNQAARSMMFLYTLDTSINACVITSVGYIN